MTLSPADPQSQTPPGSSGVRLPVFLIVTLALAGIVAYLYVQVDHLKTELAATRSNMREEVEKLREASSNSLEANRMNISKMSDELEAARRQAQMAVGQAKSDAIRRAEDLAKQLAVEQQKQAQAQAAIKSEVAEVKDTATTTSSKLGEVSSDVTNVKTEVANTKSELDKTIADLKRVNGDLDGHSVLIATNAKELSALRALGERNYYEFHLTKTKEPQKIGDTMVLLKKADPKHNRFTIELVVDDKRIEKKDRTINEPIQFMVSKSPHSPYEIIVNDVKKDQISGYLSTPKIQQARGSD